MSSEQPSEINGILPKTKGIYGICINLSRTLLASGSKNNNHVAVYRLPSFEPVAVLQGHTDLVFSLAWASETTLVSGSRDGSVRIWDLSTEIFMPFDACCIPTVIQAESEISCVLLHKAKVRSLEFNNRTDKLFSLAGDLTKIWDVNNRLNIATYKLTEGSEAVCTSNDTEKNLFAVGSQNMITLIDPRISTGVVHEIDSVDCGFGVRSIAWNKNLLTIGGGAGKISFYDLRTQQYLDVDSKVIMSGSHEDLTELKGSYRQVGKGWLNQDDTFRNYFLNHTISNAIYTLSYNHNNTRLFTGGGPLQLSLKGSYAAVWE